MDRRTTVAAFVAILLLLLLWRSGIVSRIRRAGLFSVGDGGAETVEVPGVLLPPLPGYVGPMQQTTDLICHCDDAPYSAPIIIHETIKRPVPLPMYKFIPEQTSARAAKDMIEQAAGFAW